MKTLPNTEDALVVRTDFSNQEIWMKIRETIKAPTGSFRAYVEFWEDAELKGATKDQLLSLVPEKYEHGFLIIADAETIVDAEHPLLVVDLNDDFGREFRAIPKAIQSIENNLSISNMGFEEFADSVDNDGVFRGFRQ